MGKTVRVGLNGFGRIGRSFTRIVSDRPDIDVVAINTSKTRPEMLAYLLQYDSVYRTFGQIVTDTATSINVGDQSIVCFSYLDPHDIPWSTQDVDVVLDCTGVFTSRTELAKHLTGSVTKVILTAPTDDKTIPHIVLGVNDSDFPFESASVISNASCTTNCAAPMFKILHDNFTVVSGFLTTSHAYTSSQQLLDNRGGDFTRSRAAALSIIPSTTGAAGAVVRVLPSLEGLIDGVSMRVPTPVGSFTDISCIVGTPTTVDEVNEAFKRESEKNNMGSILGYATAQLVSSDYIGDSHSCIFDSNYTAVMPHNLVKIFGCYDNEWGYSSRLADLVERLQKYL